MLSPPVLRTHSFGPCVFKDYFSEYYFSLFLLCVHVCVGKHVLVKQEVNLNFQGHFSRVTYYLFVRLFETGSLVGL